MQNGKRSAVPIWHTTTNLLLFYYDGWRGGCTLHLFVWLAALMNDVLTFSAHHFEAAHSGNSNHMVILKLIANHFDETQFHIEIGFTTQIERLITYYYAANCCMHSDASM